jgi:hypothetical protein
VGQVKVGILGSKKAVSNLIGAVFLVVTLVLAFNVMIWYYQQQSNLNAQARNLQLLQQQTMLEQIQVLKVLVTTQGQLSVTVQNVGPISAHLVDLYLTERTQPTHNRYSTSYYLNPGSTMQGIGLDLSISPPLDPQKTYSVTLITERGNGAAGYYSPTPTTTGTYATFGNLGYLSVSFTQSGFQYISQNQHTPITAWTVSKSSACGQPIIWQVTFTNHGVADATILHWSMAQMWQFLSGGGGGTATDFFIVGAGSGYQGGIVLVAYNDNNPIVVPASTTGDYQSGGQPRTLFFAADQAGGGNSDQQNLGCTLNDVFDFFIVVSYIYNGQQFNQLTPYASMVVISN